MAVERRDPVPPGRYWIFLKKEEMSVWADWTKLHSGAVKVVASETQFVTPEGFIWAATPTGDIIKDAHGEWVLFDVVAPVPWVGFGFPTIVTDPTIRSSTDVITAPAPEADKYVVEEITKALQTLIFWGGAIYLGGKLLSRKRRF